MSPVFHVEGFLEPENSVRLPQFKPLVYALKPESSRREQLSPYMSHRE
jgi:hypothetical protein